ncbi:hypothetical protein AK830_g256 [Neonectria ditissima]|uniref:G domain-containing protein n=1 Tax=Neonectria ditissima TaxID=78410 RepID=A0A0P7BYA1_9HYPO|nr:hypothetical protein AK830_g256 [Neonectria ditissima]
MFRTNFFPPRKRPLRRALTEPPTVPATGPPSEPPTEHPSQPPLPLPEAPSWPVSRPSSAQSGASSSESGTPPPSESPFQPPSEQTPVLPSDEPANVPGDDGGQARPSPRSTDVFIALMGITGSGKSSFISACSDKLVRIGHDLNACTSIVDLYAYEMSASRTVWLIDTPGFDDTEKSDSEVLEEIARWLVQAYKRKDLLHGIIYLHRITDIRMQGSARTNLVTFRQLCGKDALKKVILATTMWDKLPLKEGEKRERELKERQDFWGWMLEKGSSCHRYHNTAESARQIVHVLANHDEPIATDLQKQIVDEQRSLDQTSAGQELQSELLKERERWMKKVEQVEKEMREARLQKDLETEQLMREERERYTRMIQKVESNTDSLRKSMENLLAERDKRVAEMEGQIKKQQASYEDERRRFEERQARLERERKHLEREREKEKERVREMEEEREREIQREQDILARKQPETHVPTSLNSLDWPICPEYAVALLGPRYLVSSPSHYKNNTRHPAIKRRSTCLAFVSLGERAPDGCTSWIGGYEDGTWHRSHNLAQGYPHLGAKISSHRLSKLELCVLGPKQSYYARWLDGTRSSWAEEDVNAAFRTIERSKENGYKIVAVALGIDNSYLISYGCNSRLTGLRAKWDLKGYYPKLQKFLDDNMPLDIIAITLNFLTETDFAVVYTRSGRHSRRFLVETSDDKVTAEIDSWWTSTCDD